jgi:predicted glycosyltransferase
MNDRTVWDSGDDLLAPEGLRVLTYSHDGYGLGHLRRSIRLATGLSARVPGSSVLAVTGSWVSHYFRFPASVDYLKLPSIAKLANERYRARNLLIDDEDVIGLRSAILDATVRRYRPDVVIVDRYPLGVHKEFRAGLEWLRAERAGVRLILGLRDILDAPAAVAEEWQRHGHTAAIAHLYDRVLIYGDPAVYDAIAEYRLPPRVSAKSVYTGYLAEAEVTKRPERVRELLDGDGSRLAVCTVGGGEDGAPIARAFVGAIRRLSARGWKGVLVTGPFVPKDEWALLRRESLAGHLLVRPFIDDLPSYLNAADVVVSMGGYNTLCEVLALAVPTVVVPRERPRAEQVIRAQRWAERGIVRVVGASELSAERLEAAIIAQASVGRDELRSRIRTRFATDGVTRAVDAVLAPVAPPLAVGA